VPDPQPLAKPVIVGLPAEIDAANAAGAGLRLCAAFAPGVTVVIADLTQTVFCDSSGVSQLVLAYHCAAAHGAQLRLVVPHPNVLGVLKLTGLDGLAAGLSQPGRGAIRRAGPVSVASRG
jgi:anti-sigma B factor antagonist